MICGSDAVHVVIENHKASTSLLQRRLRIGYGRAARLIETMEEQGIVGPADGSRPREVLVSSWMKYLAPAQAPKLTPRSTKTSQPKPKSKFLQLTNRGD